MQKTRILAAALAAVLLFYSSVSAVSTAQIDVVRSKETLADSDTKIIEDFLAEAFDEFLAKKDFSDIAALRTEIVSRSSSELDSGQFQYAPRFFIAAQKEISNTLKKINNLPQSERKTLLTTNLLIIINDLGNVELSKMALDYLQNPEIMVRYWAVSCLTNPAVLSQLNMTGSSENAALAQQFTQKLLTIVQNEQSGDILIFLAQFASELKQPAANELLNQTAQKRINQYLAWKVENEMADGWILEAMANRNKVDAESTPMMAKNFAILYSLIIQRYLIGRDILPPDNIENLISVIVQSEKYVTQFVSDWQGSFKRAIEKGGESILLNEHDSLFGSATEAGKLPTAIGFDYGKNPDSSAKTAPPTLSKPPSN